MALYVVEVVELVDGVEHRGLFGPFRAEASAGDFATQLDRRQPWREAKVIPLSEPIIEVTRGGFRKSG